MARKRKRDRKTEPISAAKKAAFLAAFANTGNVLVSTGIAGIDRKTHYNWLKTDKNYVERFEVAKVEAIERMEAEALRRAVEGNDEPVFGQARGPKGEILGTQKVGIIRRYSDTLLIFLLKAANPKKYREYFSHEHSGPEGGPIEVDATREFILSRIARYAAANAGKKDSGPG